MSDDIFILIPAYNRREITLQGLRHLYQDDSIKNWHNLQIVVIDDGSTDGTEAAIQSEFSAVTILKGDGNLWWTGAIKKGMEYAYRKGCSAVFWLNDDCNPSPGSLTKMYNTSISHGQAVIGAACYIAETGTLKPTGARGRTRIAAQPGEILPVNEMSGHCVCIPKAVIETIGLPNAQHFPHYHGDSSYSLRATRAGFPAYILGDAKIMHSGLIKANIEAFSEAIKTSTAQSFKQIFLDRKSLYYLPAQFFYNIEKYGLLRGLGLFTLKLWRWLFRWSWFTLSKK